MTDTYTPGPWAVRNPSGRGSQFLDVVKLQVGTNVANVYACGADQRANANLIAAAPDLLDALESVLQLIDCGYLVRDTSRDAGDAWSMMQVEPTMKLASAVEAVAKARGTDV